MENRNIKYTSKQIKQFYSSNRQRWKDLYPSEQWVFTRIGNARAEKLGEVLDVGCACAGLGIALCEKFILNSYTGVDINSDAIEWARQEVNLPVPTSLISGDIVDLDLKQQYDMVVSLSCADWNIETAEIIASSWARVKPGGHLVISLRLTPEKGVNDISQSYQYINFSEDDEKPEIANYVVLNVKEALTILGNLEPTAEFIGAYGYWGEPSKMAVTNFEKLIFVVFYIKKEIQAIKNDIRTELFLPLDTFL